MFSAPSIQLYIKVDMTFTELGYKRQVLTTVSQRSEKIKLLGAVADGVEADMDCVHAPCTVYNRISRVYQHAERAAYRPSCYETNHLATETV